MIPGQLKVLVEAQPGHVHRLDLSAVEQELLRLGVAADSEFAAFFRSYVVTSYVSPRSYEQLCDLIEPTAEIRLGTDFIRHVWELPERFVCLTTTEGEGAYLYDRVDGTVSDFALQDRDEFLSGAQAPGWWGFFEFMTWYLSKA